MTGYTATAGLAYPQAGDGPCALSGVLAEAASRLAAVLDGLDARLAAVSGRPSFRLSAAGTTCNPEGSYVTFNAVDFDSTGLADLTYDPHGVRTAEIPGVWLLLANASLPYSSTSGNYLTLVVDQCSATVRDLDATQNPPSGGVSTSAFEVHNIAAGDDVRATVELYWSGVGAPSVPTATTAMLAGVRLGDA